MNGIENFLLIIEDDKTIIEGMKKNNQGIYLSSGNPKLSLNKLEINTGNP